MEGHIAGIALKREHRIPLEEVEEAVITPEGGLEGNIRQANHRRITFISQEQWGETMAELGAGLPWHARRANILTQGFRMPDLLGKQLRIGEVVVAVNGETDPCKRMDEIHQGLQAALEPDCRGGVYGNVLQGGTIRVGDTIRVEGESNP